MHIHLIKPSLIYGFVDYKDQDINPVFDTNTISMNNTLFSNERFAGKDKPTNVLSFPSNALLIPVRGPQ